MSWGTNPAKWAKSITIRLGEHHLAMLNEIEHYGTTTEKIRKAIAEAHLLLRNRRDTASAEAAQLAEAAPSAARKTPRGPAGRKPLGPAQDAAGGARRLPGKRKTPSSRRRAGGGR